jgi:hypothetical protein
MYLWAILDQLLTSINLDRENYYHNLKQGTSIVPCIPGDPILQYENAELKQLINKGKERMTDKWFILMGKVIV